jgi:TrpR-related protein YerC/YecD
MIEKVKDSNTDKLAEALVCIRSVDEAYRFLSDLCTISEITEMSKRLTAAEMLRDGNTYSEIAEKTRLSTATITRVNRALRYGSDGYSMVLDRIGK